MFKHIMKTSGTYPIQIFIAYKPNYETHESSIPRYYQGFEYTQKIIQKYCNDIGLCVTIKPTTFIYTNGLEPGVEIGFINYPRFASSVLDKSHNESYDTEKYDLYKKALDLTYILIELLGQESASIQTPETTHWISRREESLKEHPNLIINA